MAGDSRQLHTPNKGCHPPTHGYWQSLSIVGHHDCNDQVLLLLHGPRWHHSPWQEGKHSCGKRELCRGLMPHHGTSLHPPLSCVQKTARDGKRKRCRFRDTVIKELQIHSKNFTGVLHIRTAAEDNFLLLMSLLYYLETSDCSRSHRCDAGNSDTARGRVGG